jgi:hypothetical protein
MVSDERPHRGYEMTFLEKFQQAPPEVSVEVLGGNVVRLLLLSLIQPDLAATACGPAVSPSLVERGTPCNGEYCGLAVPP